MKEFTFLTAMLVAAAMLSVMPSCTRTEPDSEGGENLPAVVLAENTLTVSSEGGNYGFQFYIENPVESADVSVTSMDSWISDPVNNEGTVTFSVEQNTGEDERRTGIIVSYQWSEGSVSDTLAVVQEAGGYVSGMGLDLGAFANCYIVPAEGDYFFNVGKVNGGEIPGIEKVDWLWSTLPASGDTQDILENIAYEDNVVKFHATGNQGNILLAAFNASGEIVWSWHIWAADKPSTIVYENGAELMDRFIGALSATSGTLESYGVFYQWGRKDPIYAGIEDELIPENAFKTAYKETIVNEAYGRNWGYVDEGGDEAKGIANPMTMYHAEDDNWVTDHTQSSWAPDKTDQDPCPAGYKVPTADDMSSLSRGVFDVDNNGMVYTSQDGKTDWWPAQGCRDYLSGYLIIMDGMYAWTNTEYVQESTQTAGKYFYFGMRVNASPYGIWAGIRGNRAFGHPVRCVTDVAE